VSEWGDSISAVSSPHARIVPGLRPHPQQSRCLLVAPFSMEFLNDSGERFSCCYKGEEGVFPHCLKLSLVVSCLWPTAQHFRLRVLYFLGEFSESSSSSNKFGKGCAAIGRWHKGAALRSSKRKSGCSSGRTSRMVAAYYPGAPLVPVVSDLKLLIDDDDSPSRATHSLCDVRHAEIRSRK
jgi:hypothetical protein